MSFQDANLKQQEIVAESRYYQDGEKWNDLSARVAEAIFFNEDSVEQAEMQEVLQEKKFIPGGRILRNAGKPKRNMLNCFVIPINDNIESIGQCMKDSLITWASGGGVGINFSNLRPVGADIYGKGGSSSGLLSFMTAIDGVGATIESGGQRRSATIAIVDIRHPEVEDFIDAKLKHGKLQHFNISVAINDEFLLAVERGDDWELRFGNKIYKTVKARGLWNRILKNIIECAEPGIINMSKMTKANSFYYAPILGTNPCGELPLQAYGSCDLGSIVLPKFITGPGGRTSWEDMENTIRMAVRFLDNVIDFTSFPVPEMKIVAEESRRIGLGVMGLADYLFEKEIRYGSEESLEEIEKLFKFIRYIAYDASVNLAIEKGAFPKFDPVEFGKASFVRKLPANLRRRIKEHGIRNVALLTCPPTGTISLVAGVTSGIEPLFSKAYRRKDRISERVYIHPTYERLIKEEFGIPDWFVDSYDLTAEEHFETQATIQKYIDGAISKTINLPADTTVKQLAGWMQEYAFELKGVTCYVDGSREEQVLYPMSKKEVKEHLNE